MLTKTEKFYNNRLQKYFDKFYGHYDEVAEFYVNPAINRWEFNIPELELCVELVCYDNGKIFEKRTRLI